MSPQNHKHPDGGRITWKHGVSVCICSAGDLMGTLSDQPHGPYSGEGHLMTLGKKLKMHVCIVYSENCISALLILVAFTCRLYSYSIQGHFMGTHYGDVMMGSMASQITSLTIVYPIVHSGADERKHQSSASLAFVRGIHRWPVNSLHSGQ